MPPGSVCVYERCVLSSGTSAVHAVVLDLCARFPLFWAVLERYTGVRYDSGRRREWWRTKSG